jgi:hypothetical protein
LETSGDTSDRFSSELTPLTAILSVGVFCDALFGPFACEPDKFLVSRYAEPLWLGSGFCKFGAFSGSFIGFRTGKPDVCGPELGASVAGFCEVETAALEGEAGLGFWEAKRAFWVWRSKKCWMPNLEGWGWLVGLDFFDDDVVDVDADEEEEELGFFLGGIVEALQ